jgi:hypothetical protein
MFQQVNPNHDYSFLSFQHTNGIWQFAAGISNPEKPVLLFPEVAHISKKTAYFILQKVVPVR